MSTDSSRRKWIKNASVGLTLLPLIFLSRQSKANTNPALRTQFKYKDTPQENMSCISCLEFIPGKSVKDAGGCKVIPGDDEILPNGFCTRWNTM
jgi:hypothetical protein